MAGAPVPLANLGNGYTIVTHVIPSTTDQSTSNQTLSPMQQFLKGEPKALGTVQIMTGVLMILLGIVLAVYPQSISVYSGVVFWAALFHISAGSLAVSASNKLNPCQVKGALVLNVFGAIAAGISIILMSLDLALRDLFRHCYYTSSGSMCRNYALENLFLGVYGVLLVFSLLQFCISIAVSVFICRATCTDQPNVNIINMVTNPERCVPVVSPFPPHHHHPQHYHHLHNPHHHAQPAVNMMHAVDMGRPPAENPPAYCEKSKLVC